MNAESQNLNIFTVLVEQEVPVIYQQNGFSSIKSDILLPWSQGGDKAKPYVTGMNYDDVCRATWGSTFIGNGGLLPSTIDAGEEYKVNDIKITLKDLGDINPDHCQAIVMLFDANTGKYINAVRTTRVDGKQRQVSATSCQTMTPNMPTTLGTPSAVPKCQQSQLPQESIFTTARK